MYIQKTKCNHENKRYTKIKCYQTRLKYFYNNKKLF